MKVLYIDISITGHHVPYLKALSNKENENIYIIPKHVDDLLGKIHIVPYAKQDIVSFYKWYFKILKIIKQENPDIIHFAFADVLIKTFGIGLGLIKKYKIVCSFHRMDNNTFKNFSRNIIANKVDIVTTHVLGSEELFTARNQKKCHFVPYPSTLEAYYCSTKEARQKLNINTSYPVIAVVGIMSQYKNLDILFKALENVILPFYLIIAGKPSYYSETYLNDKVSKLKSIKKDKFDATLILRYISDEEFVQCISASDIIAVNYSKSFEGTSGPMTEGIRLKKTIIGSSHSNIGHYIAKYNIGYSCDADDTDALAEIFEKALKKPIKYTNIADELIKMQSAEGFRKEISVIYKSLKN